MRSNAAVRARSAVSRAVPTGRSHVDIVVVRALGRTVSCAASDAMIARDDARANRSAGDSRDSDRQQGRREAIQEVIQKKIFASIPADSNATWSPSRTPARVVERIMMGCARACRTCKKSAFHKGFLHSRKIGDEIPRGAK
jgi:hypothetical protein